MTSQNTDASVIEAEKAVVMQQLGLAYQTEIVFIDSGWDSRIYSVNDGQYIFKFPRTAKIQGRYASQIEALRLVAASQSDVLIPKVRWTAEAYKFFGYEGIQGVLLRDVVASLDDDAKQSVGVKLGGLLKVLHGLSLAGVRDLGPSEEIKQNQNWYEKGLDSSREYFNADEQRKLADLVYTIWPKRIVELGTEISLCHGDFHFDNILYTDTGEVGVIDFGDICIADHSRDFADFEDDIVFEHAMKAYASDDKNLLQKILLREDMLKVITLTAQLAKQKFDDARVTADQIKAYL